MVESPFGNTQLRVGPRQYLGVATDATTTGLERSRHEIHFAGYYSNITDKIGSKIVSINKQTASTNPPNIQSADLAFYTSPANAVDVDDTVERMRITDNGYVGIGTNAPAYTLDVSGSIRSTGTIITSNITSPAATNLQITTPAGYNLTINPVNQLIMSGNVVSLASGQNITFTIPSTCNWFYQNGSDVVATISGLGNFSNSNATSNNIGGSTLSNSILTVGAATAGSTTSGSVNVSGGYFVNGVAFTGGGGGGTISGTYTSGTVLLATGTTTGLQGSANMSFSGTLLDVNGGAVIRNGFRPSYSLVSSGTSITVAANTYGYHYNITTSGITGVTLPAGITSTDSNAYWVFRNNTSGYLSVTFTYQTAGTTPTNPVVIPPSNAITMMVTYPSSSLVYVLF